MVPSNARLPVLNYPTRWFIADLSSAVGMTLLIASVALCLVASCGRDPAPQPQYAVVAQIGEAR